MSQFCNVEFAKMTDIIKHRGIVENIEGSHVRVRIVQTSACSACSVKGHCNASESKEKLIDVFDMKASSYRIGDLWYYFHGDASRIAGFWYPFLGIADYFIYFHASYGGG